MYLSELILNPRNRQVLNELARPYELHRTLLGAFVGQMQAERVLYRLDLTYRDRIPRVMVQSRTEPDWSRLQAKDGYLLDLPSKNPRMREYDPQFAAGQRLVFRLLANPTRAIKPAGEKSKARGKRVSLGREEDQVEWLARKAASSGFQLMSIHVTGFGLQRVIIPKERGDPRVARYCAVRFDGVLEVIDPIRFRQTLEKGIGSAKGFGYGLLSIARA